MDNIDEIVAVNIFMRMEELGLTQKALAKLSKITAVHLNKLLKNKRPASKSSSLDAIAAVLHCTVVDLFQDPDRLAKESAFRKSETVNSDRLKSLNKMFSEHLLDAVSTLQKERQDTALSDAERKLLETLRDDPAKAKQIFRIAQIPFHNGDSVKERVPLPAKHKKTP